MKRKKRMITRYGDKAKMKQYETTHLVTYEDLNHHGTLFAARASAWFVEAGFVAAGSLCGTTEGIVCRSIKEMSFYKPIEKGTLVKFLAELIHAGNSSFTVKVTAVDALREVTYLDGEIVFVTIDENGKKRAHRLSVEE